VGEISAIGDWSSFVHQQEARQVRQAYKMRRIPKTHHRARMAAITFVSDLSALVLSTIAVHILIYRTIWFNFLGIGEFEHVLFMVLCLSLFMVTKLYPGIGLNPVLEMKTVTQHTTLSFIIAFTLLTIFEPMRGHSKTPLTLIYLVSIVTILGMRWGGRILTAQLELWGEPVVLIGRKAKIGSLIRYFQERRRLGFVPVLGVTEMAGEVSTSPINLMDAEAFFNLPEDHFAQIGIHTALVDTLIVSDLPKMSANRILLRKFERMIFVSDMDWLEGVSISYHDFEGMLGMEAQQNLLSPIDAVIKRTMDILISLTLGVLSLPIFFLTALLIRMDSRGPIFFTQERMGKNRHKILVYKFRSMRVNADKILTDYLDRNHEARFEWQYTQKLHNDPRITRVGKWLRKFSLDEMPQLFNIFKGDMSLVGPRPILPEQESLYGDGMDVYCSVRPGLTGFWQVSGRNNTTFHQRALYDKYYVRNWSIWLDTYILLRTVWVVLSRDGAY
jgi:Undecaprenyl-phosphate galactose phosphotransferase WbaP